MLANSITYLTNVSYGFAVSVSLFLADNAGAAGQPEPNLIQKILGNGMILPVGLFLIFYLTFLAPEKKRRAEEAKLMSSLKKNDRVVTVGGIHGTVVSVADGVVTLKIDESGSTRIKLNQSAIATRVDASKEAATKD